MTCSFYTSQQLGISITQRFYEAFIAASPYLCITTN
jgi:hypothetical protein